MSVSESSCWVSACAGACPCVRERLSILLRNVATFATTIYQRDMQLPQSTSLHKEGMINYSNLQAKTPPEKAQRNERMIVCNLYRQQAVDVTCTCYTRRFGFGYLLAPLCPPFFFTMCGGVITFTTIDCLLPRWFCTSVPLFGRVTLPCVECAYHGGCNATLQRNRVSSTLRVNFLEQLYVCQPISP
jgi:hypothetical protein